MGILILLLGRFYGSLHVQVISNLLEAGLWTQGSNLTQKGRVLKVLEESMEIGGGLIGFGKLPWPSKTTKADSTSSGY